MNNRFLELTSKTDFSDFLVWTSHSFATGFYRSESTFENTRESMNCYRNIIARFYKNSFMLELIIGLIEDGFSLYEKGYRERGSIYLTRANVYWTRKGSLNIDFLKPIATFASIKDFENQLSIAELNIVDEYWGKNILPKWHYLSLMHSCDVVADRLIDRSFVPQIRELIEKSFAWFLKGNTVDAIPPIHLATKYLHSAKTGDPSFIDYREAPWITPGLPNDYRFYC